MSAERKDHDSVHLPAASTSVRIPCTGRVVDSKVYTTSLPYLCDLSRFASKELEIVLYQEGFTMKKV